MTQPERQPQRRVSSRLIRKGALIEETYRVFQVWDLARPIRANLRQIQEDNAIGASNHAWLSEVVVTLSGRFRSEAEVRPLVLLAQRGLPLDQWRAFLLWHVGQTDALYYAFATDWLFDCYAKGQHNLRTEAVVPFLRNALRSLNRSDHALSAYGILRGARDLLRMATAFGVLQGKSVKNFAAYQIPESAFLFVLHALTELEPNCQRMMDRPEWRLFLMSSAQVEREVLNLHQFQKLEYHAAGSLTQLRLPCSTATEFAQRLST